MNFPLNYHLILKTHIISMSYMKMKSLALYDPKFINIKNIYIIGCENKVLVLSIYLSETQQLRPVQG